jgi:hypothetical protein
MKELFHNEDGFNTACIKIKTNNDIVNLYYHLNDNPVQHRWQKFYLNNNKFKTHPLEKIPLDHVVDILNKLLIPEGYSITTPIDAQQLNYLHNRFVHNESNDNKNWQEINHYIHVLEEKLNLFTEYNSVITFAIDPIPEPVPIKEEFKLWLTNDQSWGDLHLGYGTLGKSWQDIFTDNDGIDDLNVQSTISSETRLYFHIDAPWKKFNETEFYKWAVTRDDVPLDNLNKLGLGRYYLGNIIITEDLLKFHPTPSDWYVPNHSCKLRWNKEVIDAYTEVIEINFFESDMYFDTLVKHTGFNNV